MPLIKNQETENGMREIERAHNGPFKIFGWYLILGSIIGAYGSYFFLRELGLIFNFGLPIGYWLYFWILKKRKEDNKARKICLFVLLYLFTLLPIWFIWAMIVFYKNNF